MTTNSDRAARKKRQELVAQHKHWLVTRGNELGDLAKSNTDWGSQIRGIWAAALAETEPLVLLNLLRYQKARNKKSWDQVFDPLEKDLKECITKAGEDGELALDLIRHLLVYTIRSFTYYSKQGKP